MGAEQPRMPAANTKDRPGTLAPIAQLSPFPNPQYLLKLPSASKSTARSKRDTKMFCACRTSFGDTPNTHTCPVCLGLPGALPVLNRDAIEKTLLTGLMIDCALAGNLQVGPQELFLSGHAEELSDHADGPPALHRRRRPALRPLLPDRCTGRTSPHPGKVVRLNRIHLEEDVAKSTHLGNSSLIDFNRAGTPLMEIVSEPDIESAEEAFAYLRSLQMILQQGGVSDADMEKGQLRCDVNISLRKNETDPLGAEGRAEEPQLHLRHPPRHPLRDRAPDRGPRPRHPADPVHPPLGRRPRRNPAHAHQGGRARLPLLLLPRPAAHPHRADR